MINDVSQWLRSAEESFNSSDYESSVHYCLKILDVQPENTQVRINLSKLYFRLGQYELGEQQSLYLIQKYPHFLPAYTDYLINIGYFIADPEKLASRHKQMMSHYLQHVGYEPLTLPFNHWPDPSVLRIGILSADFREHAMCGFLNGIVESLRNEKVELFAYSFHATKDQFTENFKKQFNHWRDITNLTAETAINQIVQDRIHFLIDANTFTNGGRFDVTMKHPALLQASWIGYLNTTGLPCYEFKLTDRDLTPVEMQRYYSEKFLYIDTALPFIPRATKPTHLEPDLQRPWTMASFNNIQKIRPEMLEVWVRLLKKIPHAKLKMVIPANEKTRDTLFAYFVHSGVDIHKLQILPEGSFERFMSYMEDVDVALDPYPHSGGATTAHALSVGVPTVTIEGATEQGRIGSSLLKQNGGGQFVVKSIEEYFDKVVRLAESRNGSQLSSHVRRSQNIVGVIREQVELALTQKNRFSR